MSTLIAVPLLLVEVAPGADASPDANPAVYRTEAVEEHDAATVAVLADVATPRALGTVTAEELAAPRLLGQVDGDSLRAVAAAEALAAEQAEEAERLAEEERLRRLEEEEAAQEAARRLELERQAAERAARRAAEQAEVAPEPLPSDPTPAQWAALRQCESSNNYQAVSPNRLYYGAYQFYQGTWDNTARNNGRADLVGVRPDQASPADQDAMALALYRSRGDRPWPHCGAHLR